MLKKIRFFPYRCFLLIGFILLFFSHGKLSAQVSRAVYFQEQLPGASVLNPSFHPHYNVYVNLPLISSFSIGFESPFSYNELTSEYENGDSLYIDRDEVMNALKEKNYFSFELYNELGRAGFRAGQHFFHFSIAKVFSTKFAFEKDFATLLLYGNGSDQLIGKQLNFDNTGLNMTSYQQFTLGYSIKIGHKFTVGTSLKYLNGGFNIWTEKAVFNLYTANESNYPITASADISLHTSSDISDFDDLIRQVEQYKWFDLTGNDGFGFDLGVEFEPSNEYKLSASVVDLGWIKWKENTKSFTSENPGTDFTFQGFDIIDLISDGSISYDSINLFDTLTNNFKLETSYEPYTSHLNPKLYVGGLWQLNKSNELGMLIRTDFVEERVQPSFTINYTHRFGKVLSLYGNYSMLNRSYANVGLGFILKVWVVQLYLLNDMAFGLVQPANAKSYNFHFGMNFLFGTPKEKGINMPTYKSTDSQ
ncbi:MAG: DUF5723 family protein [Bacteroidales bacterium]